MAQKYNGRWLKNATVSLIKLAGSAITGILASKLLAVRPGVLNFTTGTSYQDTVTSLIAAAAQTNVPQTTLTALGVYVGTIANGPADPKATLIRLAGTLEGIDDGLGSGAEVYGILTYGSSNYTLSYFKSDGTPYTFASATAIDFYFVEVQNLNILNVDSLISGNVAGVVDASQAQTLANHLNGGPDKHLATSIQTVTTTDQYPAASSVDAALVAISSTLDGLSPADLTALTVNIAPSVANGQSVGTVANPFSAVYLADQSSNQVWEFSIIGGVITVIQVGTY